MTRLVLLDRIKVSRGPARVYGEAWKVKATLVDLVSVADQKILDGAK